MQKVIKIRLVDGYQFDDLNNRYLDNGWNIIDTIKFKETVIFVIQKDTRKEKLENIENLTT